MITTIKYWNNNNKIKIIVLLLMTLTLMASGFKCHAASVEGMPYTKVDQAMNISYKFIDSTYHFVETYAEGLVDKGYATVGHINDTNDDAYFVEIENLDGKLMLREKIDNSINWGYVGNINNVSIIATITSENGLYYPEIRLIKNGEIVRTYKCASGTTEDNAKLASLIKFDQKIYFQYPKDSKIELYEINNDTLDIKNSEVTVDGSGCSACLFYDKINEKTWALYKYSLKGRLMEYLYLLDDFSELNYKTAGSKKVTKEGANTSPNFELFEKDKVYITYLKKRYLYTYSTKTFTLNSDNSEIRPILDDDNKLIFYEDVMKSSSQMGRYVYFVNKKGNYDIELFDDEDDTKYVGANGLDIKGIVHSSSDEEVDMKVIFNNLVKQVKIKTNEEFTIHLDSSFLKEGYYDAIYFEIGSLGDSGMMFGEIPNGSTINFDGVFYDKVSDVLVVEKNPSSFTATDAAAYDVLDKTNMLTEDEWKTYKEYISAIPRMNFWLQDGKKSYHSQVSTSKKVGYTYLIYKKAIKLNEKFSYNKIDGAYYNYDSSGSKTKYNHDVWVNYAPCNTPIVRVNCDSSEFTNSDVLMNISFDGECADLKVKANVTCENLDGVSSDEMLFDFSKSSKHEWLFTKSGLYRVSLVAESPYGNKSDTVIKTFKIDKEGPYLEDVIYDNVTKSKNDLLWSTDEETTAHVVMKDLSGIPNSKQLDKYLYQIDKEVVSKKSLEFEISDNLGNKNVIKLDNNYLVDEIEPVLQKPTVEYFADRAEITLRAFDTESGLEGIYYKIGEEDEKKYDGKIIMKRDKYGSSTNVYICAKDIAGNIADDSLIINLNDAPEIILDDEYINITLDQFKSIKIITDDKDGDDVTLSLYYNNQLLCTGLNELNINLKNYEDLIKTFEYNKAYKFEITANDETEKTNKYIYLTKKNMKPVYMVNSKNINFSNYAEIDVSIYDLDDGTYGDTTCIVSCNNVELGTFNLKPGDNTIIIKNSCLEGEHELKFNLINKTFKEIVTRKVNFINLEKMDEENIFININSLYTNDFYKYALNTNGGVFFYTENSEKYLPANLLVPSVCLADARYYVKNKMPVVIYGSNIGDNDLLNLISEEDEAVEFACVAGSILDANQVVFSDYEGDYFNNDRGKNRKLNVNYNPLEFENASLKFEYNVYDPFNNLTDSKETIKEVQFKTDSFEFLVPYSGFYTLSLSEWDEIKNGEVDYSKKSDDKALSFYAHKKPTCSLSFEEIEMNGDYVKLRFTKSAKDEDYLSINNGIWKEEIGVNTYSFDGQLLKEDKIDSQDKSFNITINKNEITKVKYTVWDFGLSPIDNRFTFTACDEVVINKINTNPFADFEYVLTNGSETNGYIYEMDEHEKVRFKDKSNYNDILAQTGERNSKYEHDEDEFELMIQNGDNLYNKINITNKFGKSDTSISKKLDILKINLVNISNLDQISKSDTYLHFDIINAKDKNEIYLMYADEKITCNNGEFLVDVSNIQTDEITICLKVFSNRDNSYLGEKEFDLKFNEDMEVLEFEITNIYDPWCDSKVPISTYEMPTGPIRKGYGFDFSVTSRGLKNSGDYIYIIPKYYYILDNKILPCEIVSYNRGMIHPYVMNILNCGKQIGTLDYLYLNFDDRYLSGNEEVYTGKFYLPSDCRVRVGNDVYSDGYILVNFEIIGVSELGYAYNYNTNKWTYINNSPYNLSGDTAIFTVKYGAFNDYKNFLKY